MDSNDNNPVNAQGDSVSAAFAALPSLQMFNIAGHFAGAIAHDFNNILTGVLGNLELMQRRADRLGIADFNDYIAGSRSAAERGVAFSQALLAIAGHQALEPAAIDVNAWLTDIKHLLSEQFESSIEIRTQLPSGATNILCDETRLKDSLLQLGKNAQQSAGTKCVTLIASAAPLIDEAASRHGVKPGHYIEISMQDDGAGMSDDIAARAFEPFFSTRGASGLGLAKILGFTRQSGGHAFIAAHQPGDTKITLLLPKA